MSYKRLCLFTIVLTFTVSLLVSCGKIETKVDKKPGIGHGPPPHAPAHGYRHKYQGVKLVYDSDSGVYVVINFPLYFYSKGNFYRLKAEQWQTSVNVRGPWKLTDREQLPPGLLQYVEKIKTKSKEHTGKGRGLQKKNR